MNSSISETEKAKIASKLLLLAPPCQFNEVFSDVRILVNNDNLLKQKVTPTFAQYNKEQFLPIKLQEKQDRVLITKYNDLGDGKFYDPRTRNTFNYDHLKKVATDISSADPDNNDIEDIRKKVEQRAVYYVEQHYRQGTASVFSKKHDGEAQIIMCIESHYMKDYKSGRWRSEWIIPVKKSDQSEIDVSGLVKIQTHIFEEGNVQLLTSKNLKFSIKYSSNDSFYDDVINNIKKIENEFQEAIGDNLKKMSSTTFKSLRRQLPVTHNKVDWHKIISYEVSRSFKS